MYFADAYPESLIGWHARHELVGAIPIVEASETETGLYFCQHIVIVCPHTPLFGLRRDTIELFTRHKQV
jgi:hypothetical protein